MAQLSLQHIDKIYDNNVQAVFDFNLDVKDGELIGSNTALFCAPKHFEFQDPHLTATVEGDVITVKADAYARSVCVESEDPDLLLDDNYFDMNGGERKIRVLRGTATNVRVRSVWDIDKE